MSDSTLEPKRKQSSPRSREEFNEPAWVTAAKKESELSQNPEEKRARYERLKKTAREGMGVFYEVGSALCEIRDAKLYRLDGYSSFEAFVRAEYDLSRPRAYQLIEAAATIQILRSPDLSTIVDIPLPNEPQARELSGLAPEEKREIWAESLATAPQGMVTAKHVATVRQTRAVRRNKPEASLPEPEPAKETWAALESASTLSPAEQAQVTEFAALLGHGSLEVYAQLYPEHETPAEVVLEAHRSVMARHLELERGEPSVCLRRAIDLITKGSLRLFGDSSVNVPEIEEGLLRTEQELAAIIARLADYARVLEEGSRQNS